MCSICVHSFGALTKAVFFCFINSFVDAQYVDRNRIVGRLFMASLHNQPVYPKMCSMEIIVNHEPVGRNLKGGLFDQLFGGLGRQCVSRMGPFDGSPMVSY